MSSFPATNSRPCGPLNLHTGHIYLSALERTICSLSTHEDILLVLCNLPLVFGVSCFEATRSSRTGEIAWLEYNPWRKLTCWSLSSFCDILLGYTARSNQRVSHTLHNANSTGRTVSIPQVTLALQSAFHSMDPAVS